MQGEGYRQNDVNQLATGVLHINHHDVHVTETVSATLPLFKYKHKFGSKMALESASENVKIKNLLEGQWACPKTPLVNHALQVSLN